MEQGEKFENVSPLGLLLSFIGTSLGAALFSALGLALFIAATKSQELSQYAASSSNVIIYIALLGWLKIHFSKLTIQIKDFIPKAEKGFSWYRFCLVSICLFFFLWGLSTFEFLVKGLVFPSNVRTVISPFGSFSTGNGIMGFLYAVVLAPIVEELFFRGLLLHRLALKWSTPKAILFTSGLFSLLHCDIHIVSHFFLGFSLALLYLEAKTLLAPILFHALYNFADFIMWILFNANVAAATAPICFFLMLLSMFWAVYYYKKNWPQTNCQLPYFATCQKPESVPLPVPLCKKM